jgi:predicted dehydrogenase
MAVRSGSEVVEAPLKTALIGLGMVADTHLRALADLKDRIHLQGVFARDHRKCQAFAEGAAERLGHTPTAFESIEQIAAARLDFAVIATPPNARFEIVDALSAANVSILMEKPIERDSERAAQIVGLCEARNVTLGIVFQHRVREASVKLRALVEAGTFGALGVVDVSVPWWRDQAYYDEQGRGTYARDGGGVLISQAIHTLDLMLSLTGPVTRVQAMARTSRFHTMEAEDFVTAGLDFANGAVGSLVASTASYPGDAESITLHFDKASAVLKSGILTVTWRDGRVETFGADATTGGGADPMAFTHDWHTGIVRDFAEALGEDRAPLVTGREALTVHRLIDALVQSSRDAKAIELENP